MHGPQHDGEPRDSDNPAGDHVAGPVRAEPHTGQPRDRHQRQQQKKFKEYFGSKIYSYTLDEWIFDTGYAEDILLKHFQTHSLKGFGVDDLSIGLVAAGAIIHYLRDTEHPNLQHIAGLP